MAISETVQKTQENIIKLQRETVILSQNPTYQEFVKLKTILDAGQEIHHIITQKTTVIKMLEQKLKSLYEAENAPEELQEYQDPDYMPAQHQQREPVHNPGKAPPSVKQATPITPKENDEAEELGLNEDIDGLPKDLEEMEAEDMPEVKPEPKPVRKRWGER